MSEYAFTKWHVGAPTGRPGAPRTYSDTAITCMDGMAVRGVQVDPAGDLGTIGLSDAITQD